ncbi:olfactory receptor 2A12-like [Liasis olivaceus]
MANRTTVTEFFLLGLSSGPKTRLVLFGFFLVIYSITLTGNVIILMLIWLDSQLHTPMYFFLSHLSFVDIWYTSSTVPQLLTNLWIPKKTISFAGCGAEIYLFHGLAITECILLAVMAYDRFVAICYPLRYTLIMNQKVCIKLAGAAWLCGFLLAMVHVVHTFQMPYCGPNVINHFYCDMLAVLKLVCADTHLNEIIVFVIAVLILVCPFSFIMISYIHILIAILKIHATRSRHKAFSTCASHVTVVALFYGSAMFMYMRPGSSHSPDQGKMVSLFYSVFTPLFNPMIYSLRNKEVKGAMVKVLQRCKGKLILPLQCGEEMANRTTVTEFFLLGLSSGPKTRLVLFGIFLVVYSITLTGNVIILMLIWLDSQLHTPMYFFLSHLSFVDIWYTSSTVPQLLTNLWIPKKTISFAGCGTEIYLFHGLGITECILLA